MLRKEVNSLLSENWTIGNDPKIKSVISSTLFSNIIFYLYLDYTFIYKKPDISILSSLFTLTKTVLIKYSSKY